MNSRNKILIIAVAIVMMASAVVVGTSSSGDSGGGLTISDVGYTSGSVVFSGTSQDADVVKFFVTYPDGTYSQYGAVDVVDHSFSGAMKLDLSGGDYSLTVFTSSTVKATESFSVSEISITSVAYDHESGVLTFAGTSTETPLKFYVGYPDGSQSQYGYLDVKNGKFDGSMKITLPAGSYDLVVFASSTVKDSFSFESSGSTSIAVSMPQAVTGLKYTGQQQVGVPSGTGYTVTGGSATQPGNYTATVKLADGYVWSDGTSDDLTIQWSIAALGAVAKPIAVTGLTYNGQQQVGVPSGTGYTVTGGSATQPGNYTATVRLSDGYTWADGTTNALTISWSIASKRIAVPSAVEGLVYNGSTQIGVPSGTGYTVTGGSGTGAGDYIATVSLSGGYAWSDGSTVDKGVSWKISKAVLTAEYGGETVIQGSTPVLVIEVIGFVAGEDASSARGYTAPTIGDVPTAVGSHTLTPKGGSASDYSFVYKAGTLVITEPASTEEVVQIPVAATLSYTGLQQTGVSEGTGYRIVGNTATRAGVYEATATLENGYVWSDGSKDTKTIGWTISKGSLTATYAGETISDGDTPSLEVTVTGFVDGESASNASGYTGPSVVATDLSVGTHTLTPAGGVADDYIFTYVSGTLTVQQKAQPAGVVLNKHSVTITADSSETLQATLSQTGSDSVSWKSSNSLIVSVEDGKLTAKAYGTATITATSGGYSDSCTVTVEYASLQLSDSSMSLTAGSSGQLSVTVPAGYSASGAVWRASSSLIKISGSGSSVTVTAGSETGDATVTVIIGNLYSASCQVTVTAKPTQDNVYYFEIRMDVDADKVQHSTYTKSMLESGFTISATAGNAADALSKACSENGIQLNLFSNETLKGWIDSMFGLGDVHLANGDWKYWIQYHNGNYNDWTLGYYTDGGTFQLVYGITKDPSAQATKISKPVAVTGLTYNGRLQVGVPSGTGYTVTGGSATAPGVYTATVKLDEGYVWSDGTSSDVSIQWSIAGLGVVAKPIAVTGLTYSGQVQVGVPSGTGYTVTGGSATQPGDYTATVSLSDGYTWDDGTTDVLTIRWSIASERIAVPTAVEGLVYNGSTQVGVPSGTGYTVTGGSAIQPGDYTATVKLVDGYVWSDGTSSDVSIQWSIAPLGIIEKPVAVTGLTYNGQQQVGVPSGTGYTVTGATATAPGVYTATVKLVEGYVWSYGTTDTISIEWSITSKGITVPDAVEGLVYNGSTQIGVPAAAGYTVTGGSAANAGEYTATLSLSSGYVWADGTSADKEIGWSIARATLTAEYVGETVYSGSQPAYVVRVTGFVNGETSTTAAGYIAPTASSSDLSVGSHTLTPSGGSARNYDFTYVSGVLTIVSQSSDVHVHTWDSGTITREATCGQEGIITYACTGCDETRTESVPKVGHSWSEWTVVKEATVDEEGQKSRQCSVCGETETQSIPKVTVVVDDNGNKTTSYQEADGTGVISTESADGSTKVEKTKDDVDDSGNLINRSTSETTDADGNITEKTNIITDADGNETYSKKENFVPEVTTVDDDGTAVTVSSSTSVEKEAGRTTETQEKSTTTVATDGSKETEVIKTENTAEADGSTIAKTTTESTRESSDGTTETSKVTEVTKEDEDSVLNSRHTETKDKDGNQTSQKKVEVESKDGNVRSQVEISAGTETADIVTTVRSDSEDGNHTITAEQVAQAVSVQEKVSGEIKDDVSGQSKVIQIESATEDATLTVSQDAVRAVSEAQSELRIASETGSMSVSSQVLGNMAEEEGITISITIAKDDDINESQKPTITEESVVVDVRIMAGEKSLGKSLGGTITISVKHVPQTGKVAAAYYVDDDGRMERMSDVSFDPDRGEVAFKTSHCSLYMIVDEDDGSHTEPGSSGNDILPYIGIAIGVLAVIGVFGVLYMRRR